METAPRTSTEGARAPRVGRQAVGVGGGGSGLHGAHLGLERAEHVREERVLPSQGENPLLHHRALHVVVHQNDVFLQGFYCEKLIGFLELCQEDLEGRQGGVVLFLEFESTLTEGEAEARARGVGREKKILPPTLRPLYGHKVDAVPGGGVTQHFHALCSFQRASQDNCAVGWAILSRWGVLFTKVRPET